MIVKVLCHFPAGQLLFATRNLQDDGPTAILEHGGNWQNKIIHISSLSRNIGEDKSYEISGISIEFNDTDRVFRQMMSSNNRYIAGHKVELFSEDDQLIYTGTVEKWQFKEDAFVVFINDRLSGLDTLVAENLDKEEYPNMTDKAEGTSIPIIYGYLSSEKGAVKCWRVDTNTYLLAGHHCQSLEGAYKEDGTDISGQCQLDNNGDGNAYVSYDSIEEFICVNVKGKMDEYTNLIQDPIEAIKDIFDEYTAMNYNTQGMAAAQILMAERGYEISGLIQNQKNLQDILVDFSFSFDCDFYIDRGNEIMISLLNWRALTPVKSFSERQIVNFQMDELPEEIRNTVKYMYRYNFAAEEFQKTPVYTNESSIANWGEFFNRNEPLDLRYVSSDETATDVVQRFVIQRKNPRRVAHLDIPLSEFAGLDIADIIEIEHPGAIEENKRKYQIRRINVDFLTDLVQVEAVDITTLTGSIFILGDRQALPATWDEASGNQRDYGYLADRSTGYFGNHLDYGKVLY